MHAARPAWESGIAIAGIQLVEGYSPEGTWHYSCALTPSSGRKGTARGINAKRAQHHYAVPMEHMAAVPQRRMTACRTCSRHSEGHHDVNADGAHDSTRLPFRKCTRACTQCRRGIDAARPQSRVGVQPGSSAALLAAFRAASPTASPKAPPCSSPLDAASSVAGLPATPVFLTWCVGVTLQPLQRARATRTRFAARTALK
jgi:hypothetical protein